MNIEQCVENFIAVELLPQSIKQTASEWFIPLLLRVTKQVHAHQNIASRPFLLGINGAQGSGKSTLSSLLVRLCADVFKLQAVSLSLDDFYLTKRQRIQLSESVHPLLATRGVPGTHDTALLQATLDKLNRLQPCTLPVFDKATDDRAHTQHTKLITSPLDIIVLEGWCVGALPQDEKELVKPINTLEAEQDMDGRWRRFVNTELKDDYQQIFSQLDYLIMLKAPCFDQIYTWRCEQEHKMQQKNKAQGLVKGGMSDEQIATFVMHYQRITEHSLLHLVPLCNEVFELDQYRNIVKCHIL